MKHSLCPSSFAIFHQQFTTKNAFPTNLKIQPSSILIYIVCMPASHVFQKVLLLFSTLDLKETKNSQTEGT